MNFISLKAKYHIINIVSLCFGGIVKFLNVEKNYNAYILIMKKNDKNCENFDKINIINYHSRIKKI